MTYKLSEEEYDAMLIAGFTTVEELLKRYFELQKEVNFSKTKTYHSLDVYGINSGKISVFEDHLS